MHSAFNVTKLYIGSVVNHLINCQKTATYSWQQREVALILNGGEVMNMAPVVSEHTESSTAKLLLTQAVIKQQEVHHAVQQLIAIQIV